MSFSRRQGESLLCLVSLFLVFCSVTCLSFSETVQEKIPGLLKYEINGVYIGSLKHVIQIVNKSPTPVSGKLFVPLIRKHYVLIK